MNPENLTFEIIPIGEFEELSDQPICKWIQQRNAEKLGDLYMQIVIQKMSQLENPHGVFLAFSENEVLIGSLNYDTHAERADACRWYGRYIREYFSSPCLYLVTPMASWASGEDADCAPKDSPTRTEQALCLLRDLSPMYQATCYTTHMQAITDVMDLVWIQQMHEGMPGETVFEAARSWQANQTDPERKCLIQSNLFSEVMVGMGDHFPGIKAIMQNESQQQEFTEDVLKFEKAHGLEHEPAPWETDSEKASV